MRDIATFALVLGLAATAQARPGFYLGAGLGPTFTSGSDVAYAQLGPDEYGSSIGGGPALSTELASGLSGLVRVGWNVKGYAAVELDASGLVRDLNRDPSWAAQAQLGVRAYPLWHWRQLLPPELAPFEPSLYLGYGAAYQGGPPAPLFDSVGYGSLDAWRYGLGLEYFVSQSGKLSLDYNYVRAPYDTFFFNVDDGIEFPIEPKATTGFHQLLLVIALHVGD